MTLFKSATRGLAALIALGSITVARAQDAVPGGWSREFGVQTLATPNAWTSVYPYGTTLPGASASFVPATGLTLPSNRPNSPQVYNGLLPLAEIVRKSPRRRKGR